MPRWVFKKSKIKDFLIYEISIINLTCERVKYSEQPVKITLVINDSDIEIIANNNVSKDDTYKLLSKINNSCFKYMNTCKRVSMCANFENGISNCTGNFIMFFGDDDED